MNKVEVEYFPAVQGVVMTERIIATIGSYVSAGYFVFITDDANWVGVIKTLDTERLEDTAVLLSSMGYVVTAPSEKITELKTVHIVRSEMATGGLKWHG